MENLMSNKSIFLESLIIEKFKNLTYLKIQPNGENIFVSGKNGAGKTSMLNGIEALFDLSGLKAKFGNNLVQQGEDKAVIEGVVGPYRIKRTIRANGGTVIEVFESTDKGKEVKHSSPGSLLKGFLSVIALDPGKFAQMESKEAAQMLLDMAELDLDAYNDKIEEAESTRLYAGRDLKITKGHFESLPLDRDWPTKPIDLNSLYDLKKERIGIEERNYRKEADHQSELKVLERDIQDANGEVFNTENIVSDLEGRLAMAKERLEVFKESLSKLKATEIKFPDLETFAGPVDLDEQIDNATDLGKQYEKFKAHEDASEAFTKADKAHKEADDLVQVARDERDSAIKAAKLPLDGLSFNDKGELTIDGMPLRSLSDGQKLEIGFKVAVAQNPKLKTVIFSHPALFDKEALARALKLAEKEGYQLIMEYIEPPKDSNKGLVIQLVNGEAVIDF